METMTFSHQGNEYEIEFRQGRPVRVLKDERPLEGEELLLIMGALKAMLEQMLDRFFPHTQAH